MKKKTLICVYGKNEETELVFERLWGLYLTNFDKSFAYCALIDLPDAISYRVAGDSLLEEKAQHFTRELNRYSSNAFFCAIRQRRFAGSIEKRYFACEEGERGALKALWRFAHGKTSVLFPIFGHADIRDIKQIYFSGRAIKKEESFVKLIQPSGVSALCAEIGTMDAVFTVEGATGSGFLQTTNLIIEGLYAESGLDKLLFCGEVNLKTKPSSATELVSYPAGTLSNIKKERIIL